MLCCACTWCKSALRKMFSRRWGNRRTNLSDLGSRLGSWEMGNKLWNEFPNTSFFTGRHSCNTVSTEKRSTRLQGLCFWLVHCIQHVQKYWSNLCGSIGVGPDSPTAGSDNYVCTFSGCTFTRHGGKLLLVEAFDPQMACISCLTGLSQTSWLA